MLYTKINVFEYFFAFFNILLGHIPFTVDSFAEQVSVGIRSVSVCMSEDRRGVPSTYEKYEKSGRTMI